MFASSSSALVKNDALLELKVGTATALGPCAFNVELTPSSVMPGTLAKF